MRNILFATLAAATVFAAVPASAQIYLGGGGVQVGPFGFGVGPRYGYRNHDYDYGYRNYDNGYRNYDNDYAYGGCQLVRERVVTPRGHVIYRTRRECN
jgi:hypothetical protein